jgi:DNA-binding response OmpR family regulator
MTDTSATTVPVVLVCDDTPAKRYVLASWLRRAGYQVVEAETAAQALRVLREQTVDLAVLDVHLPDGSGLDITKAVRSDPRLASRPILHVSAVAMETADKVAGLDQGADAYLVDPIEPDEMLSTVRALLRSSGARRHAEELVTRVSRLNLAAVRLNLVSTAGRLSEATVRAAADVLESPAVVVMLDEQSRGLRATAGPGGASTGVVEPVAAAELLGQLSEPSVSVVRTGPWSEVLPVLPGDGWRVWLLRAGGHPSGFIAAPQPTDGSDEDTALMNRLAQLAAVALENVRALEREHQTAVMLQRSLLPAVLPQVPGLAIAARYRASQQAEVGGDFFDAFEVGRDVFLVIGDVQGHSLEAAVVMGELRYSLRAYAYDDHQPPEILARLDSVLGRTAPELTATACIAVVAPDRRSIRFVSAGHLPLLLCRGGTAHFLDHHGVLLGVSMGRYAAETVELLPGDRLVFVTDGLIERRTQSIDDRLAWFSGEIAATTGLPIEQVADHLLDAAGDSDDDVALMIVEVTA